MPIDDAQPLTVIIVTLFLTYSLPKILEVVMKRFGESKTSIDTQNITNALSLYESLSTRHKDLELKFDALDLKYEKAKREVDELEEKYSIMEGNYRLLEYKLEQTEEENKRLKGGPMQ